MADVPVEITIIVAVIGATAAVGGVVVSGLVTRWNDRRKARLDYARQQLSEFYSPILSLRRHIRALSELRKKVGEAVDEVYLSDAREKRPREETSKALNDTIEFDNEQMKSVLLPMYRQMMSIFREKYWLAEPEVQEHFAALVEYVELWQRNFDKTIPRDVLVAMRVEEKKLHPLYDALENQFRRRQLMLERWKPFAD